MAVTRGPKSEESCTESFQDVQGDGDGFQDVQIAAPRKFAGFALLPGGTSYARGGAYQTFIGSMVLSGNPSNSYGTTTILLAKLSSRSFYHLERVQTKV